MIWRLRLYYFLIVNEKQMRIEESMTENDTAIAEQQNNFGILLFIYVLHYFSACFQLFLRSSLSLWMCFHFICGTKCQPQSICACSLSLSILYVHMSMSRTAQFSLPMLLFFTIGIFEIVMLLLSYGLRMPPQHVNSKHTLRQLAVSPLADI